MWRTSLQAYLLCRWESHLEQFPVLEWQTEWLATPKRARYSTLIAFFVTGGKIRDKTQKNTISVHLSFFRMSMSCSQDGFAFFHSGSVCIISICYVAQLFFKLNFTFFNFSEWFEKERFLNWHKLHIFKDILNCNGTCCLYYKQQ